MQSIRTNINNDIEGWHHSLNRRAAGRCSLPLYMFVALLHKEAGLVLYKFAWSPSASLRGCRGPPTVKCGGGSSNFVRPSTRRRSH